MKQAEVDDMDKLRRYLDYRTHFYGKVYHYTNFGNLIKVLKSGKLLLNNIKNVNDAMEAATTIGQNIYVASFTYESKEAVHYWAVYGKGDPYSVRVSIGNQSVIDLPQVFLDEHNEEVENCETTYSDVIYFNKRSTLSSRKCWKHNGYYFSLCDDEKSVRNEFPALCKYDIWEHEKETRLLVRTSLDENRIFLKLQPSFFSSMSITFSPWIDDDIRQELGKTLLALLSERYGVTKNMSFMRKSSIHNQIRQK